MPTMKKMKVMEALEKQRLPTFGMRDGDLCKGARIDFAQAMIDRYGVQDAFYNKKCQFVSLDDVDLLFGRSILSAEMDFLLRPYMISPIQPVTLSQWMDLVTNFLPKAFSEESFSLYPNLLDWQIGDEFPVSPNVTPYEMGAVDLLKATDFEGYIKTLTKKKRYKFRKAQESLVNYKVDWLRELPPELIKWLQDETQLYWKKEADEEGDYIYTNAYGQIQWSINCSKYNLTRWLVLSDDEGPLNIMSFTYKHNAISLQTNSRSARRIDSCNDISIISLCAAIQAMYDSNNDLRAGCRFFDVAAETAQEINFIYKRVACNYWYNRPIYMVNTTREEVLGLDND